MVLGRLGTALLDLGVSLLEDTRGITRTRFLERADLAGDPFELGARGGVVRRLSEHEKLKLPVDLTELRACLAVLLAQIIQLQVRAHTRGQCREQSDDRRCDLPPETRTAMNRREKSRRDHRGEKDGSKTYLVIALAEGVCARVVSETNRFDPDHPFPSLLCDVSRPVPRARSRRRRHTAILVYAQAVGNTEPPRNSGWSTRDELVVGRILARQGRDQVDGLVLVVAEPCGVSRAQARTWHRSDRRPRTLDLIDGWSRTRALGYPVRGSKAGSVFVPGGSYQSVGS